MTLQEAPLYPPVPEIRHITFRSSRIIYYGPHACANCGVLICKMGHEWGGNAFTYPEGPIYPNTEWQPHVCDPKRVAKYEGLKGGATPHTLRPADGPMGQIYARCVAITQSDNTLSDMTRAMVNEIGEISKGIG